jgi:hypothetical protein
LQCETNQNPVAASPNLESRRLQVTDPYLLCGRRGKRNRVLTSERRCAEVPQQGSPETYKARVRSNEINRLLSIWTRHVGLSLQYRRGGAHTGQTLHLLEDPFREALRSAGLKLEA